MIKVPLGEFAGIGLDFDGTMSTGDLHIPARLEAYKALALETGDTRLAEIDSDIHAEAHFHASTPLGMNAWVLAESEIIEDPQDVEHELVTAVVERKHAFYRKLIENGQDEAAGASSFVKKATVRLPGAIGIGTTAHLWEVTPFLNRHGLTKYIPRQRIVTVENLSDPRNVKPHPEVYETLLGRLSIVLPERLLVVEDTPKGIEAAKLAGTITVGIAGTLTYDELARLEDHQRPDMVVEDFAELSSALGMPAR